MPAPASRNALSQAQLDITQRVRTSVLPWTGQFSPQLVEELLATYAPPQGRVIDPFVGSGTVLGEAAHQGKTAAGYDLNPAAVILAQVHCLAAAAPRHRAEGLAELGSHIPAILAAGTAAARMEDLLMQCWADVSPGVPRHLAAALIVLCDFSQSGLHPVRVQRAWQRLSRTVRALPPAPAPLGVQQADARALPAAADMVLTSPPYVNVHNYHQQYRRSVEALGWNVLRIARTEIGSNRKHRGNRFLTIIQYALDMVLALREMARIVRPGARVILVVGREAKVRGIPIRNGNLVAGLAQQGVGMEPAARQERQFTNRYGMRIREDILHFHPRPELPEISACLEGARTVARDALLQSRELTTGDTRRGVDAALAQVSHVCPSPQPAAADLAPVSSSPAGPRGV